MGRRFVRLTARLGVVGAAVLAVAGAWVGVASAHAVLESSTPSSGEAVATSPTELVFDFNEDVQISLGGVSLATAEGARVDIADAHLREGRTDVVVASVPQLQPGQYVAEFHVISADGHPVSGDIVFRVGEGAVDSSLAGAGGGVRAVGLLYGFARFLLYPALVLAVGLWLFALFVWPPVWRRVHRLAAAGAAVAAIAAALQFLLATPYLGGTSLGDAFSASRWGDVASTTVGRWLLVRLVAAALLAAFAWRRPTAAEPRDVVGGSVYALLGLAVVASAVGDGHAGATGWHSAEFLGGVAHVVLVAGWLGGLGVLLWALVRRDRWVVDGAAAHWSGVAMAYVAGIVVTGVVQAWALLPGWHALSSTYGRLLLAKSVVVLAMVALGNLGRVLLQRRADARLARSVMAELVLGLAVLVVTTVLVQTNPSAAESTAAVSASTTTVVSAPPFSAVLPQGPWTATVTLDHAAVGRQGMTVTLDDTALPLASPLTVKGRLVLAEKNLGPIPVLFEQTGDREWATTAVEIPAAGTWSLEVLVTDPSTSVRFATDIPITDPGATP